MKIGPSSRSFPRNNKIMDISEFEDHSGTLRALLLLEYVNFRSLVMGESCLWVKRNVGKLRSGFEFGCNNFL